MPKTKPKRKSRARGDSFVLELPLRVSPREARALERSLDAARNVYNAVLGEALRRLRLLRESRAWQAARLMPRGEARSAAFREISAAGGFTEYDLHRFAKSCRDGCWLRDHIGSHDMQTAATRAWRAVQQHAFGKRGKPRFKAFGRMRSIEGKADAVLVRRQLADGTEAVRYRGLTLPAIVDRGSPDGYEPRALRAETKSVRLIRRRIRGKDLWFAQFVQMGLPPRRREIGTGRVGLDLGPSEIAMVSGSDASLERFCPSVTYHSRTIRRIRRAMNRSLRATNPDCFDASGQWVRGKKAVNRSKRYLRLKDDLAEMERRAAAERQRAHGELANRVLGQGDVIITERLSYRSFQKTYGRSVRRAAPGLFVTTLRRKAASAGAVVEEISTRSTRLSQACHVTGGHVKKPLSQRHHRFPDGTRVQRDLYSAYLARHVRAGADGVGRLDLVSAREGWARAEPLLRRAETERHQAAIGTGFPRPAAVQEGGVGAART